MTSEQDHTRLADAGWVQTRTGKWHHPGLIAIQGRRRPFPTAQALTLLDAIERDAEVNAQ